jgi:putative hydrolase of the HAD superfamily
MASLALFDLDNTLLDREAAFESWAQGFIAANGLTSEAWLAIEAADEDGFRPRDSFFAQLREVLGVATDVEDLLARYHIDYPACYSVDGETVASVRKLRSKGWKVGVVTNGPPSQWAKFEATNTVDEFDAICISSVVGARKPDLAIFEEAARRCELPLNGWMVGDSATADIEGGRRAGLRTIWMSRGRQWDRSVSHPDAIAATIPEAVSIILGSGDAGVS